MAKKQKSKDYINIKRIKTYFKEEIEKYTPSKRENYINKVFYKDSRNMSEVPDPVVDLIITNQPDFKLGRQWIFRKQDIDSFITKSKSRNGDDKG